MMSNVFKVLILLATILAGLLLSGCQIGPPKGVTAFVVDDPTEFSAAMVLFPQSEDYRLPLKLKYVDANTFQTTATLAPGRYTLVLRTEAGRYVKVPIDIEAKKRLYHVTTMPRMTEDDSSSADKRASHLRGRVTLPQGAEPQALFILFLDREAVVRRVVPVSQQDSFDLEAPHEGNFWVEIFAVSANKRWKWEGGPIDLRQDFDLGAITLHELK